MNLEPRPWREASALAARAHYLGDIPSNSTHVFSASGAAAAYGPSHAPRTPAGYLELRRLVADAPSVPLSSFLAATLRSLKTEGVPGVVTWADPAQGHHGGIYQATNWIYAEPRSYSWNYHYRTPDGVVDHRKAFALLGTSSKRRIADLRPDWEPFLPAMKLRYVMPLNVSADTILEAFRAIRKPYPKPAFCGHPRRPPHSQRSAS